MTNKSNLHEMTHFDSSGTLIKPGLVASCRSGAGACSLRSKYRFWNIPGSLAALSVGGFAGSGCGILVFKH